MPVSYPLPLLSDHNVGRYTEVGGTLDLKFLPRFGWLAGWLAGRLAGPLLLSRRPLEAGRPTRAEAATATEAPAGGDQRAGGAGLTAAADSSNRINLPHCGRDSCLR